MFKYLLRTSPAILITVLLLASACKGKDVVGTKAFDFTLNKVDGGQIRYSEIKGKPTILYFFASW